MGSSVKIHFFLQEDFRIEEELISELYDYLSEDGWEYESDEYETGYIAFEDMDWTYGAPFSEAASRVSEDGGGSIRVNRKDIEGFIHFEGSRVSLFFDSTYFKDIEKFEQEGAENSRQIIELIRLLCKFFQVEYMYGDHEYYVSEVEEGKKALTKHHWVNYFSHEIARDLDDFEIESVDPYIEEEFDDGVFLVKSLRPSNL